MNFFLRLSSYTWIAALICAGGFLLWIHAARVQRVEYVSGLAEPAAVAESSSPTGYSAGLRRLIVPEHNNESYQWIAQTQQMLARGEARVRHVDYDNAPSGRDVRTPSPYRWWLGAVAWCDHVLSGRSHAQSVERAALFSDPALQLIVLVGAVLFTVWQFGAFPAALLALGWVTLFPLSGVFLAGQPTDSGLAHACALWSVLPLLAAVAGRRNTGPRIGEPAIAGRRTRRWFFVAGIVGGIGLWINVPRELPILIGVAVGGLLAAWFTRPPATTSEIVGEITPWRIWGLGGAATILVAYVAEYYPSHMDWQRLETIHPLFALAWLGAAELLERASAWRQKGNLPWTARQVTVVVLAVLAVVAVPVFSKLTGSNRFMMDEAFASRLSNLPDSPAAQNLWAWLIRDGFTFTSTATFLPVLCLGPAIWLLVRRATDESQRAGIALTLGPVLVALGFSFFQLGWWSLLDGTLLTLLIAASATTQAMPKLSRWVWCGSVALILAPGALLLFGHARGEKREALVESEVIALIERDLAYWLANQAGAGGAVVLAPPSLTTSLTFHGGLSGLGSPYWENKEGFAAAVRIAGATSPDEAQALAQDRNLTYIVIPSWDPFMDEYARLGSRQPERSLVTLLHRWLPPRWLRPVPYHLPKIPGFEGLSVVIFQVTELQDNATALSRLAEYFVEMEQADQAQEAGLALERLFPEDLSAWVARTLVCRAQGNTRGVANAVSQLPSYISRGDDRALPWDRRVSLAIALAEGKQFDLARGQLKQCLADLDEARLRSLSTLALYRLQVLGKAFGIEIADPRLRALARGLLPAEMRGNL